MDYDEWQTGPSRVGEVLGERWRLVERLGGGGMGEVYRAVHLALGRTVAIKVLRPEHALNAANVRRVLREGQAASRVVHPNIVRIEDVGVDARGLPYLVQECLEGIDLDAFTRSWRGVVPASELLPLMVPALDALGALHAAGILHRDLKPGNVFLVREASGWSPRLLDFGLATLSADPDVQPRITGSAVTLGSPAYMSPEQFRDPRTLTPSSDLWSFGVMLYELLSGVLPFPGATVGAIAIAVSTDAPVPLGKRAPSLPEPLAAMVMRCLEKDPARRPASVREMIAVCTEVLRDLPPTATPAPGESLNDVLGDLASRAVASTPFEVARPALPQVGVAAPTERPRESSLTLPRGPLVPRAWLISLAAVGLVAVVFAATQLRPRAAPVVTTPSPRPVSTAEVPVAPAPAAAPEAAPVVDPAPPPVAPAHVVARALVVRGAAHAPAIADAGAHVVAAPAPTPREQAPAAPTPREPAPCAATPLGVGIDPQYR